MPPAITLTERSNTLVAEIEFYGTKGWRLRSKTASEAHLVRGEPVNHFVHLFFTITTLGLWLLVWIPLIILGGERHKYVSVDEQGRVTSTESSRAPQKPALAQAAAPTAAAGMR